MEKRFYTNKYPINYCLRRKGNDDLENLPAGIVFTINSINGDFFELKPLSKINGLTLPLFSVAMMEKGFVNSEYSE